LLEEPDADEITAAEAQVTQSQAQLDSLLAGASAKDLEMAELNVAQAHLNLESAQRSLEDVYLMVPMAGTATAVEGVAGESVGSEALITLADLGQPHVQFWVEEADLASVAPGNAVNIVFEALPDYTFLGQIISVDPVLVDVDGTPAVQSYPSLDLAHQSGTAQPIDLLSGMNAEVEVVALGSEIAAELFGDTASALGQKVKIGSTQFTVVGIMDEKGVVGTTDYDGRVYIPLLVYFDEFSNAQFGGDTVRLVYVSAEDKDNVSDVMSQISDLLVRRHGVDPSMPDFQLMTQDSIIDAQASTTEAFRTLLAWVAAISLVVGGIGIMNIMLVGVTERTREIGLRQALGARPRDVRLQFLLEAIVLSLVGGLVGVLVDVGEAYLFNSLGTMRTELVPASIPLAFAATAAVGIFFGYYPATKAAQLDPIEALRHE
jgi:putative ABC transport system permease protein